MSYVGRRKTGSTGYGTPYAIFTNEGSKSDPPVIIDSQGNEHHGHYLNTEDGNNQFVYPDFTDPGPAKISHLGKTQDIPGFGSEFEGSDIGSLKGRANKGPGGGVPAGGGSGKFNPVATGPNTYAPTYLGGEFPSAVTSTYNPITAAPYEIVDPFEYADKSRNFNTGQIRKNVNEAQRTALDNIQTELKGLKSYVPQAAALKRSEITLDNQFNQNSRTAQVNQTLPGVSQDLEDQKSRAKTYAQGKLIDGISDLGLELDLRSQSADSSAAQGFGATSGQASKASDLLSAKERYAIAQQGEQQLDNTIKLQADLLLAPTEYSTAGTEVKVAPEVGAGRQTAEFLNTFNQNTLIPTTQGFQSKIQQNQFGTNLEQNTRTFNASNTLQNEQFNTTNLNDFALKKFDYDVGYAGTVAGSYQNQANVDLQKNHQQQALSQFNTSLQQAQKAGDKKAVASILAQILTSLGLGSDIISSITGSSSKGGDSSSSGGSNSSAPTTSNQSIDSSAYRDPSVPPEVAPQYTPNESGTGVTVPAGTQAPDGYTQVGYNPDGSSMYVPDASYNASYSSFQNEYLG